VPDPEGNDIVHKLASETFAQLLHPAFCHSLLP
jgi:hypothetical protein